MPDVTMRSISLFLFVLFATAPIFADGPPASGQIDGLKKLGARIKFDDQGVVIGVNLGERMVTDDDLERLRGLDHLQELDLTRTRVTGPGLKHVRDLAALKKLYLTETQVDDSAVVHLVGLTNLELIGLSGTKVTDATLTRLAALAKLKKVFCLGTKITDLGAEKLQRALPECLIIH